MSPQFQFLGNRENPTSLHRLNDLSDKSQATVGAGLRLAFLAVSLLIVAQTSAHAAFYTWNPTSSAWNSSGNWTGGTTGDYPGTAGGGTSSDTASFTSATSFQNVSLTSNDSLGEISFGTGISGYTISSSNSSTLTLNGVGGVIISAANTTGTNTISTNIVLGANSTIAQGGSTTPGANLILSGNISGAFSLTFSRFASGSYGTVTLSGSNSYSGGTAFGNSGPGFAIINVNNNNALGTGTLTIANNTAVIGNTSGGAITLGNAIKITTSGGNGLTFSGTGASGTGQVANTLTTTGTIAISGATTQNLSTTFGAQWTVSGSVTGTVGIAKTGAGTLILSGTNTYGGTTTVSDGASAASSGTGLNVLQFTNEASLYGGTTASWTAANISVSQVANTQTATLAFNVGGSGEFTASDISLLSGLGTASGGFQTGSILGLDTTFASGGNFVYNNNITNPNSGANGLGLIKLGTNTLTLGGSNTYTGGTTVAAGQLNITGSIASPVIVSSGAGLGGTGTISSTVAVSAGGAINLRDGSIGTLTTGNLTITTGSGTSLTFDITSGGSGNLDKVAGGTLTIGGTSGITVTIDNVTGALTTGTTLTTGTYTLVSYTGTTMSSTAFNNFSLSSTSLDGDTLSLANGANALQLIIASGGASFTTGTYTLTTSVGSSILHIGATTTATTTLANTGSGTADSETYTALGATAGIGSVTGSTGSGGPIIQGGTGTVTQTYTASTAGSGTLTGSASVTGVNGTGTATLASSTGASVFVYTGQGTWTGSGSGSWGTTETTTPANWAANGGIPGITPGFTTTDSAYFGNSIGNSSATVSLNGASPFLNNITFNNTSGGSYTLAQGSGGTIHLDATGTATVVNSSGNNTISAPVELDSAAAASAAASTTLTFSGTISDSGTQTLTVSGPGTTVLSGSNTYRGGTTVSSGTLLASNSAGSATGSGALTVNAGATVGGYGQVAASSFSVSGTGTATGARANILVGMNSASDANTSQVLTLVGSSSSAIANAKLSFNLNAAAGGALGSNPSGSGTELSVGSTAVSFDTGVGSVQLALNLQNEPAIVAGYTPYVLIAGTVASGGGGVNGSQYSGLTLGATLLNSGGITETVISGNNLQLAFGTTLDQSYYGANSYLVLYQNAGSNIDDIDVVVVPEPGTWALMLGGLAMLVSWQRRKSRG